MKKNEINTRLAKKLLRCSNKKLVQILSSWPLFLTYHAKFLETPQFSLADEYNYINELNRHYFERFMRDFGVTKISNVFYDNCGNDSDDEHKFIHRSKRRIQRKFSLYIPEYIVPLARWALREFIITA